MTEQDTFNALRRATFEQLRYIMFQNKDELHAEVKILKAQGIEEDVAITMVRSSILEKYYWTNKDFLIECDLQYARINNE